MIDTGALLPDLQELVTLLHADLIERSQERDDVAARLRALHTDRQKQQRSAQSYEEWREEFLTQVAAAWVLACVFVRYLEDNRFLRDFHLAGPDAEALAQARENFNAFMRKHPDDAERNYLLAVFRRMQTVHAVKDLFAPGKTALWAVEPSNTAAMKLLEFWHEIDDASGDLRRRFDTARGDTRFLGDLYQDLSPDIRAKYALLQTPMFVEEFILDRTLEPAIAEFGFENVRLIDPTCGSGHFLLGAFARLFRRWERKWQETGDLKDTNRIDLAQRALNQVYGVDLNPYAVAICRFRLIIAALHACELYDLDQAPDWKLNVAVGDSLLFGSRWERWSNSLRDAWLPGGVGVRISDDLEDPAELNRILGQKYHAVVGNPPYITVKDRTISILYRGRYNTCYDQYHLSSPFTERFFDLTLAAGQGHGPGYIGLIIDNAFMKREFGKALVEYLRDVDLTHVVGVENVPIPGNGTPSVILVGHNRKPVAPTVRAVLGIKGEFPVPEVPAEGKVWRSILQLIDATGESEWVNVVDMPRDRLKEHPWNMGGGGAAELKDLLDSRGVSILSHYVESMGFYQDTHADTAFVQDTAFVVRHQLQSGFRLQTRGDEVRDWTAEASEAILFPYHENLDQWAVFPAEPRWHWFQSLRTILWARSVFGGGTYRTAGRPWYDYHQFPKARARSELLLTWGEIATHNHFVLDRGGKVFNRTAPVIKLKATDEPSHFEILGLLNSSTAGFWMRQVCFPKGGDQVKQGKARVRRTWWEERFAFASTPLGEFPIPKEKPGTMARCIDSLAQQYAALQPARLMQKALPTRRALDDAREKAEPLRRQMIALQEELDWQVYHHYGLTREPLTLWRQTSTSAVVPRTDLEVCPHIDLGERAFEIVMARKMAKKELETAWFERHGSTPITELPAHWPADYRKLVLRRIKLIETDKNIGLIEQPEFKRRWSLDKPKKTFREAWHELEQQALRGWLFGRLETAHYWPRPQPGHHSPAELMSCRELARLAALDPEFQQVGELYTGSKAFDVQKLVTELVLAESVHSSPSCATPTAASASGRCGSASGKSSEPRTVWGQTSRSARGRTGRPGGLPPQRCRPSTGRRTSRRTPRSRTACGGCAANWTCRRSVGSATRRWPSGRATSSRRRSSPGRGTTTSTRPWPWRNTSTTARTATPARRIGCYLCSPAWSSFCPGYSSGTTSPTRRTRARRWATTSATWSCPTPCRPRG
jgi:hypothetical protein